MGNWNRRYRPRRNYYQEVPPSPPRPHRTEPDPTGVSHNSVPLWEQKFCTLVGSIPWHKVVVAKKYMYCHDNIISWNDSAAEEAFHSAKRRFWSEINNLHCDIPLPDPDMYIDEVDWNPDIDPELILDLDREYFNPDEKNDYKSQIGNQRAYDSASGPALNNDDNPWEANHVDDTLAAKDIAQGWNQWDDSKNPGKVENPWAQSSAQGSGTHKDNAWGGSGDMSWGWKERPNSMDKSKNWSNSCGNPWGGFVKQKGCGDIGNNSWRGRGENSWGESKCVDYRKTNGGWGSLNNSGRKREGSYQQSLGYKSSRFQGGDSGAGHFWKSKERTQKEVTFGFE